MGCHEIDMNVHTSKMHGDIPECGLCDYKAKNLEDIDIHLQTCEYFKCVVCSEKLKQFTRTKDPFLTKHKDVNANKPGVNNIKPSRENSEIYENKYHNLISIFPDWKN